MDSQIPLLLGVLKEELRMQGIRYADLAERLGTSEITIKRYLAGKGLTLERLEEICNIAGMHLNELYEILFRQSETRARRLTDEQELVLLKDLPAAFSFYLIRSGWMPQEIAREFGLKDHEMFLVLRTLERASLIEIMPRNRVRLLTTRSVEWLPHGPLRRAIDRGMLRAVATGGARLDFAHREIETLKLSPTSVRKVALLIDNLMREARALAAADLRASDPEDKWYSVLAIAQETVPEVYYRSARQHGSGGASG